MVWVGLSGAGLLAWAQTLSLLQNVQIPSEAQPISYSTAF